MEEAKNQINNLEYQEAKKPPVRTEKEKRIPKHEDSVRRIWENFRHYPICLMGVPEGEEKEHEIRNLYEKKLP